MQITFENKLRSYLIIYIVYLNKNKKMAKINLTFRMHQLAQATPAQIETALNQFEATIGKTLPQDYRQHMLSINGGDVEQYNNAHINYPTAGSGISDFFPIKYGIYTMEKSFTSNYQPLFPSSYIGIGRTQGGGLLLCL